MEAVVTARRDKAAALKLLKRIMRKYGVPRSIVTDRLRGYSAAMNDIGVAAERHEVGGRLNNRREFASAVSAARTGDAAFSKYEDAAEIQLSSRPGPQPIQSGAPSRHPADLQTETLGRISGVARPCGVDRHLKEGMCPAKSTNHRYFDNARNWVVGSPRAGLAQEQSGREFASTDSTTRAEDAAFQIARISPTILVCSRRRPKHVQRPTPSHIPPHAPRLPRRSVPDVASRHCGLNLSRDFQSSRGQI